MLPGFVTAWGGSSEVNAVSWSELRVSMASLIALPWAGGEVQGTRRSLSERTLRFCYCAAPLTALWSILLRGEVLDQVCSRSLFWAFSERKLRQPAHLGERSTFALLDMSRKSA